MNKTIINCNVMKMSLIITERNYGDIDTDDYTCNSYYIILFYSYPYNLQSDLNIDGQVIYYGEMICEGNYFSQ